MRKPVLLVVLLVLFSSVAACTSESTVEIEGTLEIPNSLGFGGSDDGVQVQFLRVENDSRCAEGVQCVRAGEAFVIVSTTVDGNPPVESRVEIGPGAQSNFSVDRFKMTMLELSPDPPPVGGVEQNEYEILLRIEES